MNIEIIGRDAEKKLLDECLESSQAALVAVYGRRRVGKTFLIRNYLQHNIAFEFSGIHDINTALQLEKFIKKISETFNKNILLPAPDNWFIALDILQGFLQKKIKRKKVVVFLDEFPWMQTARSNFLAAFENFWNTWACLQPNLCIILCGSSASWMIKNVVRNRGGLHNRITHKIALHPFSLYETEKFLLHKNIQLNRYQIAQLYMAFGGIPQYLNNVRAGLSAAQIIEEVCFLKTGFLYNEFNDLYVSLFGSAGRHVKVIRALANKPSGLSRSQIIKTGKLQTGGSATSLIEELTASSFITGYLPLGKQAKDLIYKLTDEFSLFYLKFMEGNRAGAKGTWLKLSDTPTWKTWSGLAFGNTCLKHTAAIKKALGIGGIYSENAIWRSKTATKGNGAQIDLVINRRDNCINLCEIKFYENSFVLDRKYAAQIEHKRLQFKQETNTRKHLFITLITTYPMQQSITSTGFIDHNITLDKLFTTVPL